RHEVRLAEQRLQVDRSGVQLALDGGAHARRVVVEHAHPEPERTPGDSPPDPSEAHNAERLAVDVGPPQPAPLPDRPSPGPGAVIGLDDTAGGGAWTHP